MAPRLVLAGLLLFGTAGATPNDTLIADLEGTTIPTEAVGEHYCHDFDWPRIHCFRTAEALGTAVRPWIDADAGDAAASRKPFGGATGSTALATKYVKVFQHAAFAGNLAYLQHDYANLDAVGWGDRISSYVVYNSASGEFYVNPGYGGAIDYFCCNQSVPNLTGTFNDKFSALNMN